VLTAQRREEGESSAETKRLGAAKGRLCAQVDQLLHEIYLWRVVGTDVSIGDVAYTKQQVDDMIRDEADAPWHKLDGASELYYGRRYHRAASDLERVREMMPRLHAERARLCSWAGYHLTKVEEARCALRLPEDAGCDTLLDRHSRMLRGISDGEAALRWQ